MIICPFCDGENIHGADECEHCQHSLAYLHLPKPARGIERSLLKDRMKILALKDPVCVRPDTTAAVALQMLMEHEIGCLPVIDEQDKLCGIFTERDALSRLGEQCAALANKPVSELMTAAPKSLPMTAKIAFAVHRMDVGGFRHVPIVDEHQHVQGVVSVRDILQYLTDRLSLKS